MRRSLRRSLISVGVCLGLAYLVAGGTDAPRTRAAVARSPHTLPAPTSLAGRAPTAQGPAFATAANEGIAELVGRGPHSVVSWNSRTGLWGGHIKANWWQSALATLTIVRYAERTHATSPGYQHLLHRIYDRNIYKPYATAKHNFANEFMDDTAWWGLAWLEASRYELNVRHNRTDAARFLAVAEADARYISAAPKVCGGIVWALRRLPDTITSAEFIALTAGLYNYTSAPGPFHEPVRAWTWLGDALGALNWLERTRLIMIDRGRLYNGLGARCQRIGAPMTYTEGEVADALVAVGTALHDTAYYQQAERFFRYTLTPSSGLVSHGILQERCETQPGGCRRLHYKFDLPAYKGLFINAVVDWSEATGSHAYASFFAAQARAVLDHAVAPSRDGGRQCGTPQSCQFDFLWTQPTDPSSTLGVTVGGQESAIDALTAVLPRRGPRPVTS
jgi:hypothetical protein